MLPRGIFVFLNKAKVNQVQLINVVLLKYLKLSQYVIWFDVAVNIPQGM